VKKILLRNWLSSLWQQVISLLLTWSILLLHMFILMMLNILCFVRKGAVYSSRATEFTPGFYSIFSFMCNVLYIVVCPFVSFLSAIVLSVLRCTDSDYSSGIVKLFLTTYSYAEHVLCLIRNRNCLHFENTWVHPSILFIIYLHFCHRSVSCAQRCQYLWVVHY
jgi:uncharacterized membrane protein YhaH (DUF805 family)